MKRPVWLSGVLVAGLATMSFAAEGEIKMESKPEKRETATSVDFNAALGLQFPSLTGLGARIEQAMQAADPVGLANAAHELSIAEQVSGKEASITSAQLLERAVELAKLRLIESEIKAVAAIVTDDATKKDLAAAQQQAAERAEELAKALESDEQPRGLVGDLTVYNYSYNYVDIYYDGVYLGVVFPRAYFSFHVHDPGYSHFDLYAEDAYGNYWNWHDTGSFSSYWWDLYEP
jgi:hypothetical protein